MIEKYSKGIRDYKYRTKIYNTQEDFEELIKENNYFHDWEIAYIHIPNPNEIVLGIDEGNIDYWLFKFTDIIWNTCLELDVHNRWIGELNISLDKHIIAGFDGAGITISAKKLIISHSDEIDKFPDGVEIENVEQD